MINILSFWSDIGFTIKQAFRTFTGEIAAVIYDFIVIIYDIFMYTARAQILNSEFIQKIYNKVGLILGIFMMFKLLFSLIQSLISPDKFTDEKNGYMGIIKRSVISIVLLGLTPTIFNIAFELQDLIVGSANNTDNIIYKIIVGSSPQDNAESFGRTISSTLYFNFFKEDEGQKLSNGVIITYPDEGGGKLVIDNYDNLVIDVKNGDKSFFETVNYLSITDSIGQYVIKWDWLYAIGFGIIMLYVLITYCIQVATRVIQLAYLQLIAPVPILSYISDPEGAFKNWTKQCTTTYLDLFIRLAIIYFIITVSTMITEALNGANDVLINSTGLERGSTTLTFVAIFLIIGLLMFGKRVPDLFKDLFPNLGGGPASLGFGIKSPKKMIDDIPLLKGTATLGLGAAVGGIAGVATGIKHGDGVRGKIAGAFGGFGRGIISARTSGNILKNASNGMNSTRAARQRAYEKKNDGSTFWGRNFTPGGNARTKDALDREIAANDAYVNTVKSIEAETDKDARVITAQNNLDSISKRGRATQAIVVNGRTYNAGDRIATADINDAISAAQKSIKDQRIACVEETFDGTITSGALYSLTHSAAAQVMKNSSEGYDGFSGSVDYSSTSKASANDKAKGLFDCKSTASAATGEIKNAGGSRNETYTRAEANAKYQKKGN